MTSSRVSLPSVMALRRGYSSFSLPPSDNEADLNLLFNMDNQTHGDSEDEFELPSDVDHDPLL